MYTSYRRPNYGNGNRFGGGFLAPFVLGGITGGLLAPTFNRPNNIVYYQPIPPYQNYYSQNYYYQPYPFPY